MEYDQFESERWFRYSTRMLLPMGFSFYFCPLSFGLEMVNDMRFGIRYEDDDEDDMT